MYFSFTEVIKVKIEIMRSWFKITSALIKRGDWNSETDMDRGKTMRRHRKEAASWMEECSHKPRNTKDCWQYQKLEEERKGFLTEATEGARPCAHLNLECLAFRTGENNFFLLSATHCVIVCCNSLRPTWCTGSSAVLHEFFCSTTMVLQNVVPYQHHHHHLELSLSLSLCAK